MNKLDFRSTVAVLLPLLMLLILLLADSVSDEHVNALRIEYDRMALQDLFDAGSYDNDLLLDSFLLLATEPQPDLINKDLLGLRRDRRAYIARNGAEVVAIAVPATAEDGFNGYVDLLISVDMTGRIKAARVIRDIDTDQDYGHVDVIDSQWMKAFTGNSMRDIQRISWQKISADNEYDQFVGASITPKAVADRIYNALIFFQSNRIALMSGDNS